MKKKAVTIPTLVGLFVILAGLATGMVLINSRAKPSAQAETGQTPQEVKITNVSDSSFTVSWTTAKSAPGFIQYSNRTDSSQVVAADDRDQQTASVNEYFTHYVTLKSLSPDTVYKFNIGSGKNIYTQNQNGQPYQVTTARKLTTVPAADVAYGQVNTQNGEPAEGAIVYLQLPGTVLLSSLVKSSGSWVIPLSTARKSDLTDYAIYDLAQGVEQINVQGGPLQSSQITIDTANDSPVPDIILGSNQVTPSSRPAQLILVAPQPGEKVNSGRPEIIGKAPAGAVVKIEIHSTTQINGEVTADSAGNFSYTLPTPLPPGEHTILLSTVIGGVAQTITKSFTVYAAGESTIPAFSATPSASLAPTRIPDTPAPTLRLATPTSVPPTLIPTTVPVIPTDIPLPSPTPVVQLQNSGDVGMTYILLAIAGLMITIGGWWYRKAA